MSPADKQMEIAEVAAIYGPTYVPTPSARDEYHATQSPADQKAAMAEAFSDRETDEQASSAQDGDENSATLSDATPLNENSHHIFNPERDSLPTARDVAHIEMDRMGSWVFVKTIYVNSNGQVERDLEATRAVYLFVQVDENSNIIDVSHMR